MAVAGEQLHNLGTHPVKTSVQGPFTWEQLGLFGQGILLGVWATVVTCGTVHLEGVQCKVGIKCLSCIEKQEGPTQVVQKCRHEFHIGTWKPNEETRVAPRELPGAPIVPGMHGMQRQVSTRGCSKSVATDRLLWLLEPTLAAVFCRVLNPLVSAT